MMSKDVVMVLGADGYIGWPMCMRLADHMDVVAVDNFSKRRWALEVGAKSLTDPPPFPKRRGAGVGIDFLEVDVQEVGALRDIIRSYRPSTIIHFAEQPSGPYSMIGHAQASETLANNVGGTLALAHAVMDVDPGIHIIKLGTMGEYGTPNTDIPEGFFWYTYNGRSERRLYPREAGSFYHTTKILDTDLLWFYCRTRGLRVTDIMQGPVYGHRTSDIVANNADPTQFWYDAVFGTVINRFIAQAASGHPLTVYGDGSQIRGYIYIEDSIDCLQIAMENPADEGELQVFNQWTEELSVLEIAERVAAGCRVAGIPEPPIEHLPNIRREQEGHRYRAENKKLLDLGLIPTLLTDSLMAQMLEDAYALRDRIDPSVFRPTIEWRP